MEIAEKLINSILVAIANLAKDMSEGFTRIDQRAESHELNMRKLGVFLEKLNDKVDTVIEGLEGTRESHLAKINDHEKRITALENR